MSSTYAATSARARAMIAKKGAAVVFHGVSPRVYDESTSRYTGGTPLEYAGVAVQIEGDPDRFAALNLVLTNPVTLLVAADELAASPTPGLTFAWAGLTYTIRDVNPTAPDGIAIMYEITGSR